MKYEKFKREADGVECIRIHVSEHEIVERPMVDADAELFKYGDVKETPYTKPTAADRKKKKTDDDA